MLSMWVSDSVLIQIDKLGVPRVGILNTFGLVYFGVIPYDRDEGRVDSILGRWVGFAKLWR